MKHVDLYDLKVGDHFVEEASFGQCFYGKVLAIEPFEDYQLGRVSAKDLRRNEPLHLGYNTDFPVYAPHILLVEPGDNVDKIYGDSLIT